jgi:hypothetical protein
MEKVQDIYLDNDLHAILVMPTQFPAFLEETAHKMGVAPVAARLSIYWQYPSGTLPVAVVREDEQKYEEKLYNDILTRDTRRNMEEAAGLPMGLEVIGRPFHDEQVLAIMKILEEKFRFKELNEYPKY